MVSVECGCAGVVLHPQHFQRAACIVVEGRAAGFHFNNGAERPVAGSDAVGVLPAGQCHAGKDGSRPAGVGHLRAGLCGAFAGGRHESIPWCI